MTSCRIHPVPMAVLGVTALVILFPGPSWAQSKRGSDTDAAAAGAPAEAMQPHSLEALLDDTDAIVQGVISQPAPDMAGAGAVRYRHYEVHYPVIVFQREDSALGLDPGPSWTQALSVRLVNQPVSREDGSGQSAHPAGRALTPGTESVLFLKKHAGVLNVTAAFRIADGRIVPLLPQTTFVQQYAGMKIDDFTVDVLTDLFVRQIQSTASSD